MKMENGKKGQMRIIETIIASFVIVAALAFISTMAINPPSSRNEMSDLEKVGYNVLHDLDEQGILVRFVYNVSEWSNIGAALRASLPSDVYFDLTVYYFNGTIVNTNVPIRYGSPEVFQNSSFVASVTHVFPGYQTIYDPRILILQLVRG